MENKNINGYMDTEVKHITVLWSFLNITYDESLIFGQWIYSSTVRTRSNESYVYLVCPCVHRQWLKHVDEQGRPYYYSADGSRSEWELPKVRLYRNPSVKLIKISINDCFRRGLIQIVIKITNY